MERKTHQRSDEEGRGEEEEEEGGVKEEEEGGCMRGDGEEKQSETSHQTSKPPFIRSV